jgi:hypothetical protein
LSSMKKVNCRIVDPSFTFEFWKILCIGFMVHWIIYEIYLAFDIVSYWSSHISWYAPPFNFDYGL